MAVTSGGKGINVENTPFINRPILPYSVKSGLFMKLFIDLEFDEYFLGRLFDYKDAKEHKLNHC
jgi:hypothetical protein